MSNSKFKDKFGDSHSDNWKGYDYDQLCYRRALTSTRIALEKHHAATLVDHLRNPQNAGTAIVGRIFGAFNYMDYVLLAVRAFRMLRRAFPRKRKA